MKFASLAIVAIVALVLLFILYVGGLLARFYDTLPVYIAMATDIIIALATSILAGATVWGLGEWKRRFNTRNEHELARGIIRATYQLRDTLQSSRHPAVWFDEMLFAAEEATRNGIVIKDSYIAALDARFFKIHEAASALRKELAETEVLWGRGESTKLITDFLQQVRILNVNYKRFKEYYDKVSKDRETQEESPSVPPRPSAKDNEEQRQKYEKLVLGVSDDAVGKKIAKAVADIDKWFRPKLHP